MSTKRLSLTEEMIMNEEHMGVEHLFKEEEE